MGACPGSAPLAPELESRVSLRVFSLWGFFQDERFEKCTFLELQMSNM